MVVNLWVPLKVGNFFTSSWRRILLHAVSRCVYFIHCCLHIVKSRSCRIVVGLSCLSCTCVCLSLVSCVTVTHAYLGTEWWLLLWVWSGLDRSKLWQWHQWMSLEPLSQLWHVCGYHQWVLLRVCSGFYRYGLASCGALSSLSLRFEGSKLSEVMLC